MLLVGVLVGVVGTSVNLVVGSPIRTTLVPLSTLVIYGGFYLLSDYVGVTTKLQTAAYLAVVYVIIPVAWVFNEGIYGGFPAFVPFIAASIVAVFEDRRRGFFLLSIAVITALLITSDLVIYRGAVRIADSFALTAKTIYSYVFAFVSTMILFSVFSNAYRAERARVERYAADLENLNNQLAEQALSDELTGLPNRRAMIERMRYTSEIARRNGHGFGLVIGDIDNFKQINDTYGHAIGDAVLREVADRLQSAIREQDTVARWGGEEFLVLLPNTDAHGAARLADKLRRRLAERPFITQAASIRLTMTFGAVGGCTAHTPADCEECLRRADEAMYRGKQAGKNRVVVG